MITRALTKEFMAAYDTRLITKEVIELLEVYNILLLEADEYDTDFNFKTGDVNTKVSSNKISDKTSLLANELDNINHVLRKFENQMKKVQRMLNDDEKIIYEYSLERQETDSYVQNILKKYGRAFYSAKKSCFLKIYQAFQLYDENSYFVKFKNRYY